MSSLKLRDLLIDILNGMNTRIFSKASVQKENVFKRTSFMTYATRESVSAFDPVLPFPVETGKERMTVEDFQKFMAHGYSTPLWTISTRTRKYKVSKPIKVKIYIEDNLFFAESETMIVVGTGESIADAIDDFGKQIIHFYKYYKRLSWDRITGDAIRVKGLYETLFINQD